MDLAQVNSDWPNVSTLFNKSLPDVSDSNGLYYTPELLPYIDHPLVKERQIQYTLLIEQFYYFQGFTSRLELEMVNPIFTSVAHGNFPMNLDSTLIERCHQIICDEAYHALGAYNVIAQVEANEGLPYHVPDIALLDRLDAICKDYPARYRPLIDVFFVIHAECLVTNNLRIMSEDERLVPAIRETIADHASDEFFHRASCISLLKRLWASLSVDEKQLFFTIGPKLAEAYLEPDYRHLRRCFIAHGLSESEAEVVLSESYRSNSTRTAVASNIANTVQFLRSIVARCEQRIAIS